MRALDQLARFIRAKDTDDERHEIRGYVQENSRQLAEEFSISEDALRSGIEREADDARLARRLLAEVDRTRREGRTAKTAERMRKAQEAADAVGATARCREDCWEIDLGTLLACAVTDRSHVLVFTADGFTVGTRMRPLFQFRQLRRRDAWAFVDAKGFHIRWGLAGGLNLPPCVEPNASKIYVNLAPAAACAA
jgi:hypothetical protein